MREWIKPPFFRTPSTTNSPPTLPYPPTWGLLPPRDVGTSVDAGGASDPLPQQTDTSNPLPQRMLGAHQWTLGAHQTPSPNRPVRAPLPSTDRPVRATPSPKGCWGRIISGRWGRINPLPQQTGTSTLSPNRPVRAPPLPTDRYEQPLPPKDAGGASSVDAGGASDPLPQQTGTSNPFPQQTGTSNPFPQPPTSLYKGVTDRAQS